MGDTEHGTWGSNELGRFIREQEQEQFWTGGQTIYDSRKGPKLMLSNPLRHDVDLALFQIEEDERERERLAEAQHRMYERDMAYAVRSRKLIRNVCISLFVMFVLGAILIIGGLWH